jgi:hypothetical protein
MMHKEKIYKRSSPKKKSLRRIDFEQFEGVETEQIYRSSFFKPEWDLFEVVSLLEDSEKEVELTDEKDRFLCCAGPRNRLVCKGKIVGATQFELVKTVAGVEGELFFAVNFDAVKGRVFFHEHKTTCELVYPCP